ncbi:MAG: D-glycerate dehydrogenase [Ignavibacterium album]|uniref:2-hydroxyacid dehydrogenase n=1 Tax=Ignavibacterium album TaxID=591197 RepID=UPI0026EA3CCE|nr:D-glycerate dehydrogenase [Ignavibacterium album]MBI5661406.1 D-glycerate dehydrogenase [Ignavibacterium album]
MAKKKVFITYKIPEAGINLLRKNGFSVEVYSKEKLITRQELIRNVKDADALISLLTDKIDREIIDKMERCRIIANYAVGFNNIDIDYARNKGIIVTNTPDVLTDSTADLTMTLVLACARRLNEGERIMRQKQFKGWRPELLLGYELKDKIFGIIGMGRIGLAVARRAFAFGCRIIYYSNNKKSEAEKLFNAKKVSLKTLMKSSDIISLHIPLNNKTKTLINSDYLNLMKKTAIFINTARGEVIDENHLISLLKKKKIFAAGFDVYKNEPDINPELVKLDNVVLLPHIGSATVEARSAMAKLAAKNVIAVLTGKKPITPVN